MDSESDTGGGDLEARDPRWGILGAVGALPPIPGSRKQLHGRWCDPSGYYRMGPRAESGELRVRESE